jgi:hypothetical protein
MQFKVPQNVQMADKIVGPLTLKHMIILGAGGGFAYVVYTILARDYYWEVWLPPVAFITILTLVIAFVKIYDVSFIKFIFLFIEFNLLPRKRIWQKSAAEVFIPISQKKPTEIQKKVEKKEEKAEITMKKLKNISEILDTYGKIQNNNIQN